VPVWVSDGVLHLGDDRVVSAGARRFLKTAGGWRVLWSDGSGKALPDPSRKYRFTVQRDAAVAGRTATPVAVAHVRGTGTRERLYFDRSSGLLLRQDQLDEHGALVRRVAFTEISPPREHTPDPNDVRKVGAKAGGHAPWTLRKVPDDMSVHQRVGDGFELLGVYGRTDGGTQLYYSDGLFGLSLFESNGDLAWDELPAGGRSIELHGIDARVYPTPAGSATVWESGDITYTCVTDAPLDDVQAIAGDIHRWQDQPGTWEDVGRFVTRPFSWG
jgi:hypothetical protein